MHLTEFWYPTHDSEYLCRHLFRVKYNFSIIMCHFQKYLEKYETYVFRSSHQPIHVDNGRCNHQAGLCKFQHGDMGCCHSHLHQFHNLHLITEKNEQTPNFCIVGASCSRYIISHLISLQLQNTLQLNSIFILRTSSVL